MRLKLVSTLILLLTITSVATAQKDCGNGLPCGPLPWTLPSLPILSSPTPMPTIVLTAVSTAAPAPTSGAPSSTPAPTGTIQADFSDLADQLGTLQAAVNATSAPVEVNGTPVDTESQLEEFGGQAGTFFGYVRGFSEVNLGGLTPFVSILLGALVLFLSIKSLGFILPIAAVFFRLILRIVEVVRKLIGL